MSEDQFNTIMTAIANLRVELKADIATLDSLCMGTARTMIIQYEELSKRMERIENSLRKPNGKSN